MSYDFDIIDLKGNILYTDNYTSNVYEMLNSAFLTIKEKAHLNNFYTHWTDAINYDQNINYVKQLIDELNSDPQKYKKYNPKNNWGDYITLLETLQNYYNECINLENKNIIFEMNITC